jgi:hypothetical protein
LLNRAALIGFGTYPAAAGFRMGWRAIALNSPEVDGR